MKNIETVLLDFDGTLIDSITASFEAICVIFQRQGLDRPSFEDYCVAFKYPFEQFYYDRGITLEKEQIVDEYHKIARHEDRTLFPDSIDTIHTLRSLGLKCGIVSGQQTGRILQKFSTTTVRGEFFEIVGDVECKATSIKEVMTNHDLDPGGVLYVGDTCQDMRDSISAGVVPIGITRGNPTTKLLIQAGAKFCISDLCDLRKILENSNH